MEIWFTSDLHIGHKNIIKFTGRPFASIEDMNEHIIKWFWENVKPGDTVYNLGDFIFGRQEYATSFLDRLPKFNHRFIYGNHDKVIEDNESHFRKYFTINDILYKSINGHKIMMCHYPMRGWRSSGRGSYMVHGHEHGNMKPYGRSVDIGFDSPYITGKAEHRPFTFDEVSKFLEKQEILSHHGRDL
jgi:calcineurin-like phosphoesterase family protein